MVDGLLDYVKNTNGNILNNANVFSWNLYELIQSGFYCNWPNVNSRKYFIKAESVILNSKEKILTDSFNTEIDSFFGYVVINGNNKTTFNFQIGDEIINILAENGLLLISPKLNEKHFIEWNEESPLIMVKFEILPVENIKYTKDWTPF
jgi:hypothetical protein